MLRILRGSTLLALALARAPSMASDERDRSPPSSHPVLSASFEHVGPDSTPARGRIYVDPEGRWRIDHIQPVVQKMVSTDSVTLVLYPLERLAIRIRGDLLEPPPSLFFLVHSLASNSEMAQSGFHLVDFSTAGDTSVTTWKPESTPANGPMVIVHRLRGLAVRLASVNSHGESRTYSVIETAKLGSIELPKCVRVSSSDHASVTEESVCYANFFVAADESLSSIFDTTVPPGFRVIQQTWSDR